MTSTLAAQQTASRTAYDCAAVRAAVFAWTGCRSFDYLAADVVSLGSRLLLHRLALALLRVGANGLTRTLVAHAAPGNDVFLFARQAVPDDLIRAALSANPQTQAVILGAGLDTSGLRIGAEQRAAGKAPGRFFEVDLPAVQTDKRQLTARLLRSRPELDESNIAYVPCSFGVTELGTALAAAGFDVAKPTVWVWSGVIHYLTDAAVRATLAEIERLSAPGSRLFFDFILLGAYDKPEEYGFAKNKARADSFGEVMSFGFRGVEHVREWLGEQGLTFVASYSARDTVALYEKATGHPAPSGGAPFSHLCVAAL